MKFYRPAIEKDFENFEKICNHNLKLGDDIKEMIERNAFHSAVAILAKRNRKGAAWAKPYCEDYLAYVRARKDFQNGRTVFVPY